MSTTEAASIDAQEKLKKEFKPSEVKDYADTVAHKTIVKKTVATEYANEPEPAPLDTACIECNKQMHNIDMSDSTRHN